VITRRGGPGFRVPTAIAVALVVTIIAACEPTSAPIRSRAPTRAPSVPPPSGLSTTAPGPSGGSTAAATAAATAVEHPTGSPRVDVAGTTVTIIGKSDKNTSVFALDGNYKVTSSPCPGTGVIPFVWVYEEFGAGRGTYVDAEFHLKNLKGKFYLRIVGPPTCDWTVTLTKE
jgi:hypothetical protein